MSDILSSVALFFLYIVIAATAENAVLARGLGVSRLVRLNQKDISETLTLGLSLCLVVMLAGAAAWGANLLLVQWTYRAYARPLVLTGCIGVVFLVLLFALSFKYQKPAFRRAVNVLPVATFNATVMGSLLFTTVQNYSLPRTLAFCLGTGIGYVLAVLLVDEARGRMEGDDIPAPFRGLPATMLYLGILALAIYAFTGHMVLV